MGVFGFQLVPGQEEPLAYCCSEAQAVREARTTRRELVAGGGCILAPNAIYRVELAEPTAKTLVSVLNHPDALASALVLKKVVVGYVREDCH